LIGWAIAFSLTYCYIENPGGTYAGRTATQMAGAVSVSVAAVISYTMRPVAVEYTSLFLLTFFPIFGILDFHQTWYFAGTHAFWLLWTGMVIGGALKDAKLVGWFANRLHRMSSSFTMLVLFSVIFSLIFSIFIPSATARAVILAKTGSTIAETAGVSGVQAECIIMALILTSAYCGAGTLIGSAPNPIIESLASSMAKDYGITADVYWGEWFIYMFLVWGVICAIMSFITIFIMFRKEISEAPDLKPVEGPPKPMSEQGKRMLVYLLLGTIFLAFHSEWGLNVETTSTMLCVVMAIYAPVTWIGVAPLEKLKENSNMSVLVYIVGVVSIGSALNYNGILSVIGKWMDGSLAGIESKFLTYWVIGLISTPCTFLGGGAVAAAVVTPAFMAAEHSVSSISIDALVFSIAGGVTCAFLPYQSPPMMLGQKMSGGKITNKKLIPCMCMMAIIGCLILQPLNAAIFLQGMKIDTF